MSGSNLAENATCASPDAWGTPPLHILFSSFCERGEGGSLGEDFGRSWCFVRWTNGGLRVHSLRLY